MYGMVASKSQSLTTPEFAYVAISSAGFKIRDCGSKRKKKREMQGGANRIPEYVMSSISKGG